MILANDLPIYLLDEDEIVSDSLTVLIESYGFRVKDFASAAAFLKEPDFGSTGCLVLGFNRLVMDGLDLIEALRQRSAGLPVIFIVGGGNAATKAAVLSAGAAAHLERPVEEAALIRSIKAALKWRGDPDLSAAADEQQLPAAPPLST